jgi:hypothetical protein
MYLYTCGLFNNAVSSTGYVASNDGTEVNDEWKLFRKEAVIRCLEVCLK